MKQLKLWSHCIDEGDLYSAEYDLYLTTYSVSPVIEDTECRIYTWSQRLCTRALFPHFFQSLNFNLEIASSLIAHHSPLFLLFVGPKTETSKKNPRRHSKQVQADASSTTAIIFSSVCRFNYKGGLRAFDFA
jgi:hypothetical protein